MNDTERTYTVNIRHKKTGRKYRWFYYLEDKTNDGESIAVYGHQYPRYARTAADFEKSFEFIDPENVPLKVIYKNPNT